MIAIDAGNSRIKWGVHDGSCWVGRGALSTGDVVHLADLSRQWPADEPIVACNVAGNAIEDKIALALADRASLLRWLHPTGEACGVRNGYDDPAQLGADRWAALIGAREAVAGDCLVVCAGTATTVDYLDASGVFHGGLILPGFDLMLASLARNTAQLPLAQGHFRDEPRNTMDAIVSGCLQAQAGAIERRFRACAATDETVCLLTGGAAPRIASLLSIPFKLVENLILDGLRRFGASS